MDNLAVGICFRKKPGLFVAPPGEVVNRKSSSRENRSASEAVAFVSRSNAIISQDAILWVPLSTNTYDTAQKKLR